MYCSLQLLTSLQILCATSVGSMTSILIFCARTVSVPDSPQPLRTIVRNNTPVMQEIKDVGVVPLARFCFILHSSASNLSPSRIYFVQAKRRIARRSVFLIESHHPSPKANGSVSNYFSENNSFHASLKNTDSLSSFPLSRIAIPYLKRDATRVFA